MAATSQPVGDNTEWTITLLGIQSSLAGQLEIETDGATILSAAAGATFMDDGQLPLGAPGLDNGGFEQGIAIDGTRVFAALGTNLVDTTLEPPTFELEETYLTFVTEGNGSQSLTIGGQFGYQAVEFGLTPVGVTGAGAGATPENPILPNVAEPGNFEFDNVPSGGWFDPPPVEAFTYVMESDSLFTAILDFPPGFSHPFEVSADGQSLGLFTAGDSVDFVELLGDGVSEFVVSGISPLVDPADPLAFPLRLAFDTSFASFRMVSAIPEPPSALLIIMGALAAYSFSRADRQPRSCLRSPHRRQFADTLSHSGCIARCRLGTGRSR